MADSSKPLISCLNNLLLFHKQEREFFNRLINSLGQPQIPMQWIMSLWLWFESVGHHDFIRRVSSSSDYHILRFLAEANACLHRIIFNSSLEQHDDEQLPLTSTLVAKPISLRCFDQYRDIVLNGVVYFLKNVSEIIFDDNVMHNSSLSSSLSSALMLNPMSRPWSPEEQRSMFITFSRGYPLTREEIKDFFNMRFGRPCVETVMIEKVAMGVTPMYGRVVFTAASDIVEVLNGQRRTAKFIINGRHLWARMYIPRYLSN